MNIFFCSWNYGKENLRFNEHELQAIGLAFDYASMQEEMENLNSMSSFLYVINELFVFLINCHIGLKTVLTNALNTRQQLLKCVGFSLKKVKEQSWMEMLTFQKICDRRLLMSHATKQADATNVALCQSDRTNILWDIQEETKKLSSVDLSTEWELIIRIMQ